MSNDTAVLNQNGAFGVGTHFGELAFRFIGPPEDSCDYWDGEPDAGD